MARRALPPDAAGFGMEEIYGPRAARIQCRRLEVEDAYLASIRRADHLPQTPHLLPDALLELARERGAADLAW
eukprot:11202279-Lingulodinium_polyedra.AAC.1